MRVRWILTSILLLCLVSARPAAAGGAVVPDTAPGRRLDELLALINAGNRDSLVTYARTRFVPGMLEPDVDSIVDFLFGQYTVNGGYDVRRVMQSADAQITVLVQGRRAKDRWMRLVVGAEPDPPQRVQGIFLYQAAAALAEDDDGPIPPDEVPVRLAKLLDGVAAEGGFSGSVCLTRDGKTLLDRAWGEADREAHVPNRPDTRFGIASVGKTFTAVAIAQLVESGRLRFDDRVERYIPGWLNPAARGITVEQLLGHTSGLGDFLGVAAGDRSGRIYDRLADYRAIALADTPSFRPGTGFQYSNIGYLLLGAVIEAVSGEAWDHYVEAHVFAPAGMHATTAHRPRQGAGTVATGYVEGADGTLSSNDDLLVGRGTPAGGSASTAADLAAFANALRSGRLISKPMLARMTEPRQALPGTGLMYGYGFTTSSGDASRRVWGHTGGFRGVGALLEVYERDGYVLAVLSNRTDGAQEVGGMFRDLLRRGTAPAAAK